MKTENLAAIILATTMLTGCATVQSGSGSVTGTYAMHVGAYDWGCGTNRIILTLNEPIDSVEKGDFTVTETKQAYDFSDKTFPLTIQNFNRKITDAYLSDVSGNRAKKASGYITIDLWCSPTEGSPFLYQFKSGRNVWNDTYELTIALKDDAALTSGGTKVTSFSIDKKYTTKTTDADMFTFHAFDASNGQHYKYATYEPKKHTDTLVVWLHGAGEGGITAGTGTSDLFITLLGNKVTPLAEKKFQTTVGGAYVLVPQCPSMWMDDGTEQYTKDGKSIYTESLEELIETYKKQCGAKKVILAGCSNGGFMTMNLLMKYPSVYTAAVPICEAYSNKWISDDMLEKIKDKPLFFVYSKDDTVVPPADNEILVINRLKSMQASDLHAHISDHVTDTSGKYMDKDGNPYQYMGHWSWIYFFNNEANCNDCKVSVWDWIAEQIK